MCIIFTMNIWELLETIKFKLSFIHFKEKKYYEVLCQWYFSSFLWKRSTLVFPPKFQACCLDIHLNTRGRDNRVWMFTNLIRVPEEIKPKKLLRGSLLLELLLTDTGNNGISIT